MSDARLSDNPLDAVAEEYTRLPKGEVASIPRYVIDTSSPRRAMPTIGDRVVIAPAVGHPTFHGVGACVIPDATGVVDELTVANGGPENGHGTFVRIDCPHSCRVALAQSEMRRVGG